MRWKEYIRRLVGVGKQVAKFRLRRAKSHDPNLDLHRKHGHR